MVFQGQLIPFEQETLSYVDGFAKDLHSALVARNLTEIVDVIFVSDHGMTDTSHPEMVYLDDILGDDGIASMEHVDGASAFILSKSLTV